MARGAEETIAKDFFFVRANGTYNNIRYEDILYIESQSDGYTRMVTKQETYIVNNTLLVIQRYLPKTDFCRIHAGFIVGIRHIKCFDRQKLLLKDPPADGSYKQGFAYRTEFAIGVRHVIKMREQMILVMSTRGGTGHKFKVLKQETKLEEMELAE